MEKETLNDLLKKMPESPPRMWSIENYQRLLEHIDFGIYKPIFQKETIDGSVFFDLKYEDFPSSTMNKFHFSKIELWIKDLLLVQAKREKSLRWSSSSSKKSRELSSSDPALFKEKVIEGFFKKRDLLKEQEFSLLSFSKIYSSNLDWTLSLKDIDKGLIYTLTQKGGIIGREKENKIYINDPEVSKFNSEIVFSPNIKAFLVIDRNSKNGSFIHLGALVPRIKLKRDYLFEICDFFVKIIDFNPNQLIIEVINIKNGETTDKQTIPLDKSPLYLSFNEKDLKLVKEDRNNYDFKLETLKNTKFLYINQNKGKNIWFKIPKETWFPLRKGLFFKAADYQFEVLEGPEFIYPKCQCIESGFILKADSYEAFCEKCNKNKGKEIYWDN